MSPYDVMLLDAYAYAYGCAAAANQLDGVDWRERAMAAESRVVQLEADVERLDRSYLSRTSGSSNTP